MATKSTENQVKKEEQPKVVDNPKIETASKEAVQDPSNDVDDALKARLDALDAEIRKARELNERTAEKEKELDEKLKNAKPLGEAPSGVKQNVIVSHASKAQRMKEHLEKQDKVRIFVPTEGKEKKGTVLPVTLNGYRVNVPKGVYVSVPQQIGDIIAESLNQTQDATDIKENLDNVDPDKRARIFS